MALDTMNIKKIPIFIEYTYESKVDNKIRDKFEKNIDTYLLNILKNLSYVYKDTFTKKERISNVRNTSLDMKAINEESKMDNLHLYLKTAQYYRRLKRFSNNLNKIVTIKPDAVDPEVQENKEIDKNIAEIVDTVNEFVHKKCGNYQDKYVLVGVLDDQCIFYDTKNDTLVDRDHTFLCSGFMFIKSSEKTIDLFDPKKVEKYAKPGWGDQKYINKIICKMCIDERCNSCFCLDRSSSVM